MLKIRLARLLEIGNHHTATRIMKLLRTIFKWSVYLLAITMVVAVSAYFLLRPASPFKSALAKTDRLELYLLQSKLPTFDEKSKLDDDKTFPIRAYGTTRTPILGHVTLTGEKLEKVRESFLSATRPGSIQAMCHYPIYGFRFFRGSDLVVETSVCFHCHNFYVLKEDGYSWECLSYFTGGLQRILNEILPIETGKAP